jgi:DNA-directed RNA polymerase specialized sigma24 family protein
LRLIDLLDEPLHVQVALLKLDGHTNDEIAESIGYTRRTVQRILTVIRQNWTALLEEGDADE